MQLKNFILKSKFSNFIFFVSFFSHIYLWDLPNIISAAEINFVNLKFLRYLILFSLIACVLNKKFFDKNIIIFSFIFLAQISINYLFYEQILNLKEFGSILFFLILYIIVKNEKEKILNYLKYFFEIIILIVFFGLVINFLTIENKFTTGCNFFLIDSLIFHENSHFAMMFTSILVYYIFEKKNYRNMFFLSLTILNTISYLSLTFLAGLCFSLILCLFVDFFQNKKKERKTLIILLLILLLGVLFITKNDCTGRFKYFVEKTNKNFEIEKFKDNPSLTSREILIKEEKIYNELLKERNLSSQVYSIAFHNTLYTIQKRITGWGFNSYERLYDFNLMNIIQKYFAYEYKNNMVAHKNYQLLTLNRNDARSTLLKIINEFGIFIIIFIFYTKNFLFNNNINIVNKLTISTLLITQSVSGAGYFNGGFAIFLFLMICLSSSNQKN